ncbi:ABC transporter ATP-binding protein [Candidatus Woesearchaeota archaeon]|nr:ABC transporter ATP-binding protein [Candidatus Woesearchaeota archaeon]
MGALSVTGLVKKYGDFTALAGINLTVKKGEFFGLLGPNGAGKSTLINIIGGLLSYDAGTATAFGLPLQEVKQRMNVVSAYADLHSILTVEQNLRVYAHIYGVKDREKKIADLLSMFELQHLKSKRSNHLSSGEKSRVMLCKGLLNDPELLLLDECTVGLDPDIAEKTRRILLAYQQRTGATILFTSHYMHEVEELCGRIAFLQQGKILKIGTASVLKQMIKRQIISIDFVKADPALLAFLREKGVIITHSEGNTISFELHEEDEKLYKLLNRLFQQGYKIKDLKITKSTLDDVFIKIARHEI